MAVAGTVVQAEGKVWQWGREVRKNQVGLGTPPHWCHVRVTVGAQSAGLGWRARSVCASETFSCRRQGFTECSPGQQGNRGDIHERSAKTFTKVGGKRGAISSPSREVGLVVVKIKPKEPLEPIMMFLVLEDESQRWEIGLGEVSRALMAFSLWAVQSKIVLELGGQGASSLFHMA